MRWFADHQPFTPVMETLRGLLLGTAIGSNAIQAVAWCAGITLVCFLWAKALYNRDPFGDQDQTGPRSRVGSTSRLLIPLSPMTLRSPGIGERQCARASGVDDTVAAAFPDHR